MVRNRYLSLDSCACAYSQAQCRAESDGVYGPWYAASVDDRWGDDPGEGRYCNDRADTGGGYRYSYSSSDRTPPIGYERGYRGGFGSTGSIRSAAS
jgi:hypothetical protein